MSTDERAAACVPGADRADGGGGFVDPGDRPRSWHDAAYGEPLAHPLDLDGRKSSCESHDPDFVAKTAEIIGLYLDPPEGALVLAVDEKPHIPGRR